MAIRCMRKIQFCYGHRLVDHPGKCATLHGHNATVEIHAEATKTSASDDELLDDQGMIVDFGILKAEVGEWIEEHWDHTMILAEHDHKTVELVSQCPAAKPLFLLPSNPTAENLALYLLHEVCPRLLSPHGVVVTKIVFWETPNCFAEAELSERPLL